MVATGRKETMAAQRVGGAEQPVEAGEREESEDQGQRSEQRGRRLGASDEVRLTK